MEVSTPGPAGFLSCRSQEENSETHRIHPVLPPPSLVGPEAKGKLWLGLTGEMLPASDSTSASVDVVGERSASGQALSTVHVG